MILLNQPSSGPGREGGEAPADPEQRLLHEVLCVVVVAVRR